MNLKFRCKKCRKLGITGLSMYNDTALFIQTPWYEDPKGLLHNCIYCRSCGAVHDTIGSLSLGIIQLLLKRVPSKVVVVYANEEFRKLLRIGNPGFVGLDSMHPNVIQAMENDGRLNEEDLEGYAPDVNFLSQCLKEDKATIRREAVIALGRLGDNKGIAPLRELLQREKYPAIIKQAKAVICQLGDRP